MPFARLYDWDLVPLGTRTDRQIAELIGASVWAVMHARTERGIPPYRNTKLDVSRARELRRRGKTWAGIAAVLGVDPSTVRRALKARPVGRPKSRLPRLPGTPATEEKLCASCERMLPATPAQYPLNGHHPDSSPRLRSECHACYRARQARLYLRRKSRDSKRLHATAKSLRGSVD